MREEEGALDFFVEGPRGVLAIGKTPTRNPTDTDKPTDKDTPAREHEDELADEDTPIDMLDARQRSDHHHDHRSTHDRHTNDMK